MHLEYLIENRFLFLNQNLNDSFFLVKIKNSVVFCYCAKNEAFY
ncbi:hypothetical protein FEM08_15620 [Flavobacterium gilvum]|nr:hypothetical protein FEM08_15620 [Flavobacterium gilvum]